MSEIESVFLALADRTRLRLLNLLRGEEVCVTFLIDVLNESQPKISRHLACLRAAGIIESRREGKWIYYKLCETPNDFTFQILKNTFLWLDSQEELQREYNKLSETRGLQNNHVAAVSETQLNAFDKPNMSNKQNYELEIYML